MSQHHHPQSPALAHSDDADLQRLMRATLQAPDESADAAALHDRVLAQWHQHHGPSGARTAWPGPAGRRRRLLHRLLAATACAALLAWWLQPDPSLRELQRPDVLSQMTLDTL